jgi:aminopeptidase YwaD
MKPIGKIFQLLAAIILVSCSNTGKRDVTTGELLNHIKYLSSDSLKGRLTGSAGDSLAADYIRAELKSYGLVPLEGDGLQRFKVTDKVTLGENNSLIVNKVNCTIEKDFTPLSFSENSSLESEVVFAGYGFNINTDSIKWNDYSKLNVKGRWVLILRSDPEPENTMSKFAPFAVDRDKALLAKDMGAAGLIFVSGEVLDKEDNFEPLVKGEFSVGIPVFRIKRTLADVILAKSGTKIGDLEKKLNKIRKPAGFSTGVAINGKTEIIQHRVNTRNVVMILPGNDEKLKNEYIIVGGHFDHLGMGGPGSHSRAPDTVGVHHGADDNASGIAMMLELAEKFAGTRGSHKRSIICIAFTGEEDGMFGSKYFTDNPEVDLLKVDAMINMDMVGRLKDTKDLQIGGVGTADGLREKAVALCDTNLLKLTFTEEGSGPSDFSSFYAKNIPVLFFTTGAHSDYHTPSDTWDKINYKGMVIVSDLIFKMTSELACDTAKLHFKEAGPKTEVTRSYRKGGVTLGIMPDFAGIVKNGLRADLVTPGKPAANGGMKKGDIIIAIEGKPVNNIQDYMYRLNQLKHGQIIPVEVMRNNKKEVLIIKLN